MRLVLAALLVALWCSPGLAQVPEDQRTEATARWLAVAFVAEAGWADPRHREAAKDHRAIFHVLRKRWPQMAKRWPKRFPTFLSVIQVYVAAFDSRTPKAGRVRWLLALSEPGRPPGPPRGWPAERARWEHHRVWWAEALERANRCLRGERCRDPYRGRALHWGGAMDPPSGCMVKLPDAGTLNTFYGVDADCRRRRNRGR